MRVYRILLIVLTFSCLVSQTSYSKAAEPLPLDDPNAVAKIVLSAIKNIHLPKSGRGTATMKTENYEPSHDGKELIVEFSFKGKNSRTDIFESDSGIKGSRLTSTIVSEKHHISLGADTVFVSRARTHYDYGRDFHPEVFMTFKRALIWKDLMMFIEHPEFDSLVEFNRSVKLDNNGILHLIDRGHFVMPDDEYDQGYHYSFDTQKKMLPVYCSSEVWHDPNHWGRTQVKLEWKKYKTDWYVSRVESGMKPTNTNHKIVTIKDFKPNVEIADEEFTLDGMDIPDDFLIVDRVSGLQYRYVKPENKSESP